VTDPRVAAQRQQARAAGEKGRDDRGRTAATRQLVFAGNPRRGNGEQKAGGQADEHEAREGQRVGPLLDEAQARVDHCRAQPEERGEAQGGDGKRDLRPQRRCARAYGRPPEHDDRDERRQHDHLAREPRGAPHGRRPPGPLGAAEVEERAAEAGHEEDGGDGEHRRAEARSDGESAERGDGERDDQALRRPGEGREEDDGEGRIHFASVGPAGEAAGRVGGPATSVIRRGRYWFAGFVCHSGMSE
jgi:hypothetical protein